MTTLSLDAEALYAELLAGVRMLLQPDAALVGIWSGGAWLAERLHADLQRPVAGLLRRSKRCPVVARRCDGKLRRRWPVGC